MNTATPIKDGSATRNGMERPLDGRVVAGVSLAIANRTGIPAWLVRLAFVVATLLGGLGALLYAAGWMLLPGEGADQAPLDRWLNDVQTPIARAGAVLIGIAGVVALGWIFPVGVVAVVTLLVAGLLLVRHGQTSNSEKEEA